MSFDIAEDHTRFVFADDPVFEEDGLPAYGNYFVTQGYLYPKGTLAEGVDGVLEDGSAAFPELVLGEWSCWGTHVGDGAHTTEGPWVVTTQLFSLGEVAGRDSVTSEGYELVDIGVRVRRAVTGGTGRFVAATGQQVQQMLGFSAFTGVELRAELRLQRP